MSVWRVFFLLLVCGGILFFGYRKFGMQEKKDRTLVYHNGRLVKEKTEGEWLLHFCYKTRIGRLLHFF